MVDDVQDLAPLNQFVASAGQDEFDFNFPIEADSDLVIDVDGTILELETDYEVAGEGNDTGGTVTLVEALTGGEIVTVYRDIPIARTSDFQQNGQWSSSATNTEFDRITMILQQLETRIGRSLRFPITAQATDTETTLTPLSNWLDRYIYIDADGVPTPAAGVSDVTLTQDLLGILANPLTTEEDAEGLEALAPNYRPYDTRRYALVDDGTSNMASQLQSLFDAAASAGDIDLPTVVHLYGNYRCDSGLEIDATLVKVEGHGSILDFSNVTANEFVGVRVITSGTDINIDGARNTTRGVTDVVIYMPSHTLRTAGVAVEVVDPEDDGSGNYRFALAPLSNVAIIGGAYGLRLGNGVFGTTFMNITIGHAAGHTLGTAIHSNSWTDGGEQVKFIGGFIYNAVKAVHLEVSGSIRFIGTNIDGCLCISHQLNSGQLSFMGCYFEFTDGDDTTVKFQVADTNSRLDLLGCDFSVRNDLLALRDSVALISNAGRVYMRDCVMAASSSSAWYRANDGVLVSGSGTVYARGNDFPVFSAPPLVSSNLQLMRYPLIDNASALADFAMSNTGGGDNPARVAGVADGAAVSRDVLQFKVNSAAAAFDDSTAVFTRRCEPGDLFAVWGDLFTVGFGGSAVIFQAQTWFVDSDGGVISSVSSDTIVSTQIANWTQFRFTSAAAPSGAFEVKLSMRILPSAIAAQDKIVNVSPLRIGRPAGTSQ